MLICNSIKNCPQNWASWQRLKNFIVWLFIGMKLLPILLKYRYGLPMINGLPTRFLAYGHRISGHVCQNIFLSFSQMAIVYLWCRRRCKVTSIKSPNAKMCGMDSRRNRMLHSPLIKHPNSKNRKLATTWLDTKRRVLEHTAGASSREQRWSPFSNN